ncbi:hypothetical protein ABEB36_008268 [Hypothenemus hampei]|uniref:Protein aurora borealis n=1 Tax=Hypothenemus hampei TaxID=57062 RepID=A0ABD1EL99_HYPHA
MDFKHINEKYMTPKSQVNIFGKRMSNGVIAESPFKNLPSYSTPPSRFAKIINPFEPHIMDRLHLPTFSPNVFTQNSTPNGEFKFKWTIEDISSFKPAEIDESLVDQHYHTADPQTESLVQQKINMFFQETQIAPSPMTNVVKTVPSLKDCRREDFDKTDEKINAPKTCNGATQTILTLPPVLPAELEEALKPYFNYEGDDESNDSNMDNSNLYPKLFNFKTDSSDSSNSSYQELSSPGYSSCTFPPISTSDDIPELSDCTLSPITNGSMTKSRKSVCRLTFSEKMSVDTSFNVPDFDNSGENPTGLVNASLSPKRSKEMSNSSSNWSMEYKQISLSPPSTNRELRMDISNAETPHSKIFIGKGQRKRLSESFKNEEFEADDNAIHFEDMCAKSRTKIIRNEFSDVGYFTQDVTRDFSNNCNSMFASTPSKRTHFKTNF